ncbi:ankyrin repeat-containing protein [Achlya hypogyna]|uniref:Ankyrin repeat-containing protein n=1 Tax=Achlya hypogyna TaxID=1202772 RepID=A0A1V9ZT89_ACHHY|nr:ankyrin repeat-containing protein [Achlya hypogyna]
MTITVLMDQDLFLLIVQYQNGLPLRVRRVLALAEQVIIKPCINTAPYFPSAYLSNFPPPYADLEYIKRVSTRSGSIFNYLLFLSGNYAAPALPLHLAIVEGNLDHVQHLAAWEPAWVSHESVSLAAMCGRLQILQHISKLPNGAPTADAMNLAAMNGYLDVVKWMHGLPDGPGCTTRAMMDGAVALGHVNVVSFMHENQSEGCTTGALHDAICSGHAAVVDYVLSKGVQILAEPTVRSAEMRYCQQALDNDHFRTIQDHAFIDVALRQLLKDNGRWPVDGVGDNGSLWDLKKELSWAQWELRDANNRQPRRSTFTAMDIAACHGDLPTVQLLHRLRLKSCTKNAIDYACARGHLDVARWLHTHRCEGHTPNAIIYAAVGGHLQVIQWLHTVLGEPCSNDALVAAAGRGDIAMLTYLLTLPKRAKEGSAVLVSQRLARISDGLVRYTANGLALDVAAAQGHLSAIQLLNHRRPLSSTVATLLRSVFLSWSWPTDSLWYIHKASTAAMDLAAANGHLDVVKYLHAHRNEGCTAKAFEQAISHGHDNIVKFLASHYASVVTDRRSLFMVAAQRGSIATMENLWLLLPIELTPELGEEMAEALITPGHLDLIKWLVETKGLSCTQNTLEYAQSHGHQRVVNVDDDTVFLSLLSDLRDHNSTDDNDDDSAVPPAKKRARVSLRAEIEHLRCKHDVLAARLAALVALDPLPVESAWAARAKEQAIAAQVACHENARLRDALQVQLRLIASLQRAFQRAPSISSFPSLATWKFAALGCTNRHEAMASIATNQRSQLTSEWIRHDMHTYEASDETVRKRFLSTDDDGSILYVHVIECLTWDIDMNTLSTILYEIFTRHWGDDPYVFALNEVARVQSGRYVTYLSAEHCDEHLAYLKFVATVPGQNMPPVEGRSIVYRFIEDNRVIIGSKSILEDALYPFDPANFIDNQHTCYILALDTTYGYAYKHCAGIYAGDGNLDHVKHLAAWQQSWVSYKTVSLAAMWGQLCILQHLSTLPNGAPTAEAMDYAAINGHLDVVQWMHSLLDGPGCTTAAMQWMGRQHMDTSKLEHYETIDNGYAPIMSYLLNIVEWDAYFKAMGIAACLGDLPTLQLLHPRERWMVPAHAVISKAQWLHTNRSEGCTPYAMVFAAVGGHLSVVQWLHTVRQEPCSEDALAAAAIRGDIVMVTYLLTLPMTKGKWLIETKRFEVSQKALEYAQYSVDKRSRDLLDIILAYQDGWYEEQLELIVSLELKGLHHLVQAAQQQPMPSIELVADIIGPWVAKHGVAAARRLVRDMADVGCMLFLYCAYDGDAALLAGLHGTLPARDHRRLVHAAASCGNVDIMTFLHTHGYDGFSADTMDTAAECGHLGVVRFLHATRREGCTTKALDMAIYNGHAEVAEWLYAHRTEGCSHSGALFAAKRGYGSLLRQMVADRRLNLVGSEIVHAARAGHLSVVQYLATSAAATHVRQAKYAAKARGHADVDAYLAQNLAVH